MLNRILTKSMLIWLGILPLAFINGGLRETVLLPLIGMNGLLNDKKHTGNMREDLISVAQGSYTGQENYLDEQVVRDGDLITANGTGYLEFTREVLTALNAYPLDYIESNYQFF